MSDNMLQSLDDFKVLFIQSWCFKHPSLPPPPPKKNIPAKHYVLSKRYLLKANGCKLIFLKWSIDMHCECLISRYFHKFRTNRGRRLGAACRKRGGVKTILKSWLLCHIIFEKKNDNLNLKNRNVGHMNSIWFLVL